jgi:carbamoyltransferase
MLLVAHVLDKHRRKITEAEQRPFGIEKLNVPRSKIPAVTHVDYWARIQALHADTHPHYHPLISFRDKTGCAVVVNTSFDIRGEPIVFTPEDTFYCCIETEIEVLAAGNCVLQKEDRNASMKLNYNDLFFLD